MKKNLLLGSIVLTLFSISILIFQMSCSQQAPAQTSNSNCIGPQPKFQFKANGNLYICDAIFDSRLGWVGNVIPYNVVPHIQPDGQNGSYGLTGWVKNASGNTFINFYFPSTNTVTVGTYNSSSSDCQFSFDSHSYNSGSQVINFTRVSNGTADGTFSGTVQSVMATPTQVVTITEGVFSNIPVFN